MAMQPEEFTQDSPGDIEQSEHVREASASVAHRRD